ncbi:hypothetical protein MNVM_12180 [Mycobacterium novum]|uniref:PD-(D/E)XK motif protein n=2 Tax=Mycobacterium novum TaxID=2492438 RepID=A0A7I7JJS2_9MYCO|nr:hypothetical protein MNVM_12180 [Mycobacterium novum]
MSADPKRHLSRSALDEYLYNPSPAVVTIPGVPNCRLVVDPERRRIALQSPYDGLPVPALDLEYAELKAVSTGGTQWYELSIQYARHPHESYLFLSDIADLIQQEGCSFEEATMSAVATFEQILAHSRSLSRERQIGLFGELIFLLSCIQATTAGESIAAWKGYAPHEHDFVFPTGAFEVKTTTTETRRHRISSLDQLSPLPDSPLWLVSIQLTSASPATGRTLAQVVEEARRLADDDPELDKSLARAGWRDRDSATYRTPYRLRSTPVAYAIRGDFPALTRPAIARGCRNPELIVDASYIVDVTGLTANEPPSPANLFTRG